MNQHMQDAVKPIGDALSISVVVATIASWLPAIAALASLVWTAIRIYETETVQKLLRRNKPAEGSCHE